MTITIPTAAISMEYLLLLLLLLLLPSHILIRYTNIFIPQGRLFSNKTRHHLNTRPVIHDNILHPMGLDILLWPSESDVFTYYYSGDTIEYYGTTTHWAAGQSAVDGAILVAATGETASVF